MQIDHKTTKACIELIDALRIEINRIQLFPDTDYYASESKNLSDLKFLLAYKILPEFKSQFSFPLIVVLTGGTNVGKTTIFNLLTRSNLSLANPVGGNTQAPIFALPGHKKSDDPFEEFLISSEKKISLISLDAIHEYNSKEFDAISFIDSPDIDSINQKNHLLAEKLLLLADTVILITTKEKYADLKALLALARALEIQKDVIVVFNKTDVLELGQIYEDFSTKSDISPIYKTHFPFKYEFNAKPNRNVYTHRDYHELDGLRSFLTRLNNRHNDLKHQIVKSNLSFIVTKLNSMRKILSYEQNKIAEIKKYLERLKSQAELEYQAFIKQMKFIEFEVAVEMAVKDLKIPLVDAVYDKVSEAFMSIFKAGKNAFKPVFQVPDDETSLKSKISSVDRLTAIKRRKAKDRQFITTLIEKRCHEFLIRLGNQKEDPISRAFYKKIDFDALFSHIQTNVPGFYSQIDHELEQQFRDLTTSIENWFHERKITKYSLIAIKLLLMTGIGILSAILTGGIGLEDLVISSISPLVVKRVLDALNPHLSFIKKERQRFEKIHQDMFERIFNKVMIDYFNQTSLKTLAAYDLLKLDKLTSQIQLALKKI